MDFNQWLEQNGKQVKDGWDEWCFYHARYRNQFSADFRIPVPDFYLECMYNKDPERGPKTLAYLKRQFEAGTPVPIPPPVPAPPGNSLKSRVDAHTQSSNSLGEAMRRGAAEGFKGEAKKSVRTIMGLFKR